MFSNTFQSQSTWSRSERSQYSNEDIENPTSMVSDDYSRPPTPHISPQLSYLRGTPKNSDKARTYYSPTPSTSSASPTSYDYPSPIRKVSPTPTTRRREGVMRLESILNEVSVDPSYALWASSRRSRSTSECDDRYTLTTVEGAQETCVASERASSEDGESEVNSNDGHPIISKRSHRCSQCGKSFPRPSGLKTHILIHTKEKPFTCTHPGCGRTFSVASNARRHMRLHGIGLDSESLSPEQSIPPLKVDFDQPIVVDCPNNGTVGSDGLRRLKWSAARVKTLVPS